MQLAFFADELFTSSVVSERFSRHSGTFYREEAHGRYLVDLLLRDPGLQPERDRHQQTLMDLLSPEYRARVNASLAELNAGVQNADS